MEPTRTMAAGANMVQQPAGETGQEMALVEYLDFIGRHRGGKTQ